MTAPSVPSSRLCFTLSTTNKLVVVVVSLVLATITTSSAELPFYLKMCNTSRRPYILSVQRDLRAIEIGQSMILDLRGGASKPKKKAKSRTSSTLASKTATGKNKVGSSTKAAEKEKESSAFGSTLQKYKKILPLTRIHITMVAAATMLGLVLGEESAQEVLALDPIRTLYGMQLWRPLTAASYLGPPSMSWLISGYHLFTYGSSLERAYGTAQHLVLLLSQIVLLSIFSILLGQPFFASSIITALLHVISRASPYQKTQWLVFTVPHWSLPYAFMVGDVLQAQSAMAALPHILGILSGHFYYFHKFIWPKVENGGEDWLVAPDAVVRRIDPASKVELKIDNNNKKGSKARKQNSGQKLGSAR